MTKWEYKLVSTELHITDRLNELGAQGWEMVALDTSYDRGWFWLKRPLYTHRDGRLTTEEGVEVRPLTDVTKPE